FYTSVRLDIRRIGALKVGDEIKGNKTRIKIVKNKLAPPFKSVEVELRYGDGICPAADLIKLAEDAGVLQKSGSWYSYRDERLGQGRENVRTRLLEDTDFAKKLHTDVRMAHGLIVAADITKAAEAK
ncbi:MAG: recombination protein RecA, partial [Kiritimatiellia bacterium]